jgi:hypothetical protein
MLARIRELIAAFALRATDRRMTSAGRADERVLVAPRLVFFLTRRRMAFLKDTARRKLLEEPVNKWSSLRTFLREEDVSIAELIYAVGYLLKSGIYPAAAFLTALATLLGTLHAIGLL